MEIILSGIVGGVVANVYFLVYKKLHTRLYGEEAKINYVYATALFIGLVLIVGLAVLGAYFLYKKYFMN